LIGCIPHAIIITVSSINGDHALIIWPAVYFSSTFIVGGGSFSNLQMLLGFQNLRKITSETIEPIPAITSGRAGPRKFEENH
jgi:hypothetical protein